MRRVHLDALDRAQHGDGRGDDAVAVEQRGAHQADDHHYGVPPALPGALRADQRQQCEDAALAVIVGTHDEDRVLDRDDDDQRPEDQRDHTEHRFGRDGACGARGLGGGVERIEGAGADVAEYDAHAGNGSPGGAPRLAWAREIGWCGGTHRRWPAAAAFTARSMSDEEEIRIAGADEPSWCRVRQTRGGMEVDLVVRGEFVGGPDMQQLARATTLWKGASIFDKTIPRHAQLPVEQQGDFPRRVALAVQRGPVQRQLARHRPVGPSTGTTTLD